MNKHCVFEYLYRDAGNYKVWGQLLLEGELTDEKTARQSAGRFVIEWRDNAVRWQTARHAESR